MNPTVNPVVNPIEHILREYPVIVLDGALATELERYGCDLNDRLWSAKVLLDRPELIQQVHLDYLAAGADCVTTASYQATVEGFMSTGLSEAEALQAIQQSVRIAVQARDEFWGQVENRSRRPKPLVAASVGPYGAFLADGSEYRGDYRLTEAELAEFHRPRMEALVAAGADLLACETIPSLAEAKAIVQLLESFPHMCAWISFSARDGLHISDGHAVAECAAWLDTQPQVVATGINCTPPQHIPSLIREICTWTKKPVIVYPNSGESYDAISKKWGGGSDKEAYGVEARGWYECGARLIGGCCRTTPADIRAIATWARDTGD